FYIYVYKHRKTIVKIRISGHVPDVRNNIYNINNQKFNSLYIDYSQIVSKPPHKTIVDGIRMNVNPNKVDYVYLQLNKITLTKTVVQVIMSKVVEYLLKSKLAQASEDKLQVAWAVSEN
ncbi:MAG: hypothetical protein FWC41_11570, partial [Firmicutes bacterium]|nr:hypothetical protein [Bacillota bacterium]